MKEEGIESVTEYFGKQINTLLNKISFRHFKNQRRYSFDYQYKSDFDAIHKALHKEAERSSTAISPALSNKLPIFLPHETSRIAFFAYKSKSVRPVDTDELERLLHRRAKNMNLSPAEAKKQIRKDMEMFKAYQEEHDYDAYRMDVATMAIQFNAYDNADNLLIAKSFVRGGLVFDMSPEEFEEKITISYPRHRKQRSDKKTEYLPLSLIKIRGVHLKKD